MSKLRMPSINQVTFAGRLGQAPELKYTSSNRAFASASLANTEYFRDKDNQSQQRTTWMRVEAWGDQAERFAELKKGRPVLVEGKLTARTWDDDGGTRHTVVAINIYRFQPLDWTDDEKKPEGIQDDDLAF